MNKKNSRPVRKQPQRTCIICRTTGDKRALVRIVRLAAGGVQVDERGKLPGRGAYLCHQVTCWQSALESRALDRALNTQLSVDERALLQVHSAKVQAGGKGIAGTGPQGL